MMRMIMMTNRSLYVKRVNDDVHNDVDNDVDDVDVDDDDEDEDDDDDDDMIPTRYRFNNSYHP